MVLQVGHEASLGMIVISDNLMIFWPSSEEACAEHDQTCRSISTFWRAVTNQEVVMRLLDLRTAFSLPSTRQLLLPEFSNGAEVGA